MISLYHWQDHWFVKIIYCVHASHLKWHLHYACENTFCFARWHRYNVMTMICWKTTQLWSTYDVYFKLPFCGVRHSFTANRRNIKYNQFEETWNAFIWFQETYKSLTRIHNIPMNHVDHIFTIYVQYKDISLLRYPNGCPPFNVYIYVTHVLTYVEIPFFSMHVIAAHWKLLKLSANNTLI